MITLATLAGATEQEVFDQVSKHLLTQKRKSLNGSNCMYLAENGDKCAAGCLISDDEYDKNIESESWKGLVLHYGYITIMHSELITELQRIHDEYEVEYWVEELTDLAKEYDLTLNTN